MSVRLRRLQAEHERLRHLFENHPRISIVEMAGDPPDRYTIEYRLKGLVQEKDSIRVRETHRAKILLGPNFPMEMAQCVMLTPVFHPNIDHLSICTADIGSVGEKLDQVVTFIGEMIAYQAYNLQSPRNGEAAKWAREHASELPLEHVDLTPSTLLEGRTLKTIAAPASDSRRAPAPVCCANCGTPASGIEFQRCSGGHLACPDCILECAYCQTLLCVSCELPPCSKCQAVVCDDCGLDCACCGCKLCPKHIDNCPTCGRLECVACAAKCTTEKASAEQELTRPLPNPNWVELHGELAPIDRASESAAAQSSPNVSGHGGLQIHAALDEQLDPPISHASSALASTDLLLENQLPVVVTIDNEAIDSRIEVVVQAPSSELPQPRANSSAAPVAPLKHDFQGGAHPIVLTSDDVASVPDSALVRSNRHVHIEPELGKKLSGKAIAALIFGIVGFPLLGILLGWFAIVLAAMAIRDIRANLGLAGRSLAKAAIVLGILDILIWALFVAIYGLTLFLYPTPAIQPPAPISISFIVWAPKCET